YDEADIQEQQPRLSRGASGEKKGKADANTVTRNSSGLSSVAAVPGTLLSPANPGNNNSKNNNDNNNILFRELSDGDGMYRSTSKQSKRAVENQRSELSDGDGMDRSISQQRKRAVENGKSELSDVEGMGKIPEQQQQQQQQQQPCLGTGSSSIVGRDEKKNKACDAEARTQSPSGGSSAAAPSSFLSSMAGVTPYTDTSQLSVEDEEGELGDVDR
ncbi:unnamed protein product, partial [Polarella glacialis]